MPRTPNVQRRGSGYRFRLRVPDDLREKMGKREIVHRLPREYQAACREARRLRVVWDEKFERLRNPEPGFQLPDMRRPSAGWHDRPVRDPDPAQLRELARREYDRREAEAGEARLQGSGEPIDEAWIDQERQHYDDRASELDRSDHLEHAADVASRHWPDTRLSDEALAKLSEYLRRSELLRLDRVASGAPPADPLLTTAGRSIGDVIDGYLADPRETPTAPKADPFRRRVLDAFKAKVGATTPIGDIKREQVRHFRDEISAGRSPKTVRSMLSALSVFFRWAVDEGHIAENPVRNVAPKKSATNGKERVPFSPEALATVLGNLPNDPPHRFWVPWLAAYTGARLNELCQLRTADVVEIDGVRCIRITADDETGQRLKTAQSARLVPIHWHLLDLAFAEFVASKPAGDVFPDIKTAASGYRSDNVSKWFRRYLVKVGAVEPGATFHSFRHGFKDALLAADVPDAAVRQLGGWSGRDVADGYGKGYDAKKLAEFVSRVRYPKVTPSDKFVWRPGDLETD